MRKSFLNLKTLLVAAGLCVGSMSAWAETYSGTVNFEAKNRSTYADGTFTTASNAGNGYALAIADLSGLENIESATSVTLEFDVTISGRLLMGIGDKTVRGTNANGSNGATYNTDGLIMRYGTSDGSYVRVNGGTNNSNLMSTSSHVSFTLDRVTGKYSYTITYVNDESETVTGLSGSNYSTTVSNATVVEAYSWSSNQNNALSAVSYSYEYSPSSFDYSVKAITEGGTELKTFASGTSNEAITTYYPYAINVNGDWYTTTASTYSVTVTAINPTATVVYVRDEQIVGFYEETTSGTNAGLSNGASGTVAAQNKRDRGTSAGTLVPGQYQFIARLVADGNSGRAITLREGANDPIASATANNTSKTETVEFTIYATTGSLYINGANSGTEKTNLSTSFDYILIKRIGDATLSSLISSAGWATLYTPYALDFSDVDGLTAYTATLAEGVVTLKEVDDVPANTGVVLKGDAKTYDIPVIASSETAQGDLEGNATEATAFDAVDGKTLYVLTKNGDNAEFNPVTSGSIAAGKAYLPVAEAGAKLRVVIEGETTGIAAIEATTVESDVIYNLAGQRVMNPTKGIFIKNGKKFIIK